jgi:hypothetical protein
MASSAASPSLSLLSFTSKPPYPSGSQRLFASFRTDGLFAPLTLKSRRGRGIVVKVDDVDADGGGADEYDMDDEEVEEVDNKKDYDVEYDPLAAAIAAAGGGGDGDIAFVQSKSFISTQGWDSDMVVDYRINEDEFHKLSLMDCDFFIRKPPDPDNDVYDFREVCEFPVTLIAHFFDFSRVCAHSSIVNCFVWVAADVCYSSGYRYLLNSESSCTDASKGQSFILIGCCFCNAYALF